MKIHTTGILQFDNHVISGIKINRTTTHPMLYAGYSGNDGRCDGAAYSDPYRSLFRSQFLDWESVVLQGTSKITL